MSGHSKWATTKHKKAVIDAKRGKLFAKLIKNIEVAARTGGGDPAGNPTLYDAIQKAKKTSVPNENIERAVKRGSGLEAGGAEWQTIMYEGYAPGGVALLIECLTDNRNRAAGEVRTAMTRGGGSMADMGIYSLWPVFTELNLPSPVSADAWATHTNIIEEQVSKRNKNDFAFPAACTIHFTFPARGGSPAPELFWYDGGIKPRLPAELEAANIEWPIEGILFVGDQGKIFAGFNGQMPQVAAKGKIEPLFPVQIKF